MAHSYGSFNSLLRHKEQSNVLTVYGFQELARVAGKAAALLKIRRVWFGQNTWNGPCVALALIWPRAFPAPLEPAGAIMWQQNAIISQLSHRRHVAARFLPHWCDSCEQAANGRTRDNDPEQEWDDSGGTDWWWNYSVKSALKIKLRLMDGIVFCDGTVPIIDAKRQLSK